MTVGRKRVGGPLSAEEETFENTALSLRPSLRPLFKHRFNVSSVAFSIIIFYKEMDY